LPPLKNFLDDFGRYSDWSEQFPMLLLGRGDKLPGAADRHQGGDVLSTMDDTDAGDWLRSPRDIELFAQTLFQADGHAMTLLLADLDPTNA
jgi:hypothetical protein